MAIHRTIVTLTFVPSVITAIKKLPLSANEAACVLPPGEPVRIMCERGDGEVLVKSIVEAKKDDPESINHGWCMTSRKHISADPDYSIPDPDALFLFDRVKQRAETVALVKRAEAGEPTPATTSVADPRPVGPVAHYHYAEDNNYGYGTDGWPAQEAKPKIPAIPRFTVE